jgi:hypothetical protein
MQTPTAFQQIPIEERPSRHAAGRLRFGLALMVGLLLAVAPGPADAQGRQSDGDRPNILWLIAEDMGVDLGVYGQDNVRTPHLDSLAAQGMLFTHAFTTSPVCSPSRSALNTGMYPFTIGAHEHRSHRPDDPSPYPHPLPEGVETIADRLRHAGYFTGNVETFREGVSFEGTGKTDWNFSYAGRPFDTAPSTARSTLPSPTGATSGIGPTNSSTRRSPPASWTCRRTTPTTRSCARTGPST